jgi:hypothetical protein
MGGSTSSGTTVSTTIAGEDSASQLQQQQRSAPSSPSYALTSGSSTHGMQTTYNDTESCYCVQ